MKLETKLCALAKDAHDVHDVRDFVFRYTELRPYEVEVVIKDKYGDVSWVFSRELLDEGRKGPTGLGDVQVWPEDEVVMIKFIGEDNESLACVFDHYDIVEFVHRMFHEVPRDREDLFVNVDEFIAQVLSEREI